VREIRFEGLNEAELAERLGLPRVVLRERTTSTMDVAHGVASTGAPPGTLVLTDEQTRGRGRSGAKWSASPGQAILCTLVERPAVGAVLDVLSLRVGLQLAAALDPLADARIALKWPNDLYVNGRKLAGILIETRWRVRNAEWVAVAAGINVGAPPADVPGATGLKAGTSRLDALMRAIPAMRRAVELMGELTTRELDEWRSRDYLAGKRIAEPIAGVAAGILPAGDLLIETDEGERSVRTGSVVLENA